MSIPALSRTHPARCADLGVFSLGNPAVDTKALRYIQHRYASRADDIVVSGSGLPVFAAVARLLKYGVSPTRITVVVREEEGTIQGLTEKNVSVLLCTACAVPALLSVCSTVSGTCACRRLDCAMSFSSPFIVRTYIIVETTCSAR
jgi:hypothetical protein